MTNMSCALWIMSNLGPRDGAGTPYSTEFGMPSFIFKLCTQP